MSIKGTEQVKFETKPIHTASWDALIAEAMSFARWTGETPVFVYAESVGRCELAEQSLAETRLPDLPFEGRLFKDPVEVRWRVTGEGKLLAWSSREWPWESARGLAVHKLVRRYYLLGRATEKPREFREARYPAKTFGYPVVARGKDDRAYVRVAEYFRQRPDWTTDDVERVLAEPLLVMHRFVDVGAGIGREER